MPQQAEPGRNSRTSSAAFAATRSRTRTSGSRSRSSVATSPGVALALAGWRSGHLSAEQAQASLAISVGQCMNQFASDPSLSEFFGIAIANARNLASFDEHFGVWWVRMLSTDSDSRVDSPTMGQLQAA